MLVLDAWLSGLVAAFVIWDINKDSLGFGLLHFEGVAFSGGKLSCGIWTTNW